MKELIFLRSRVKEL